MAKIADILSLIRRFAPENATEPDFEDNVGLIVGSQNGESIGALLCLDCTEGVIAEAKEKGYKLVISHHPAIFRSVSRVTDETPTGRMILAAAREGISVYSAHTNLDFCQGGLNDFAAELIGLKNIRPMAVENDIGIGRIGELDDSVTATVLAGKVADIFSDKRAAVAGNGNKTVKRVAVVNGGGGDISFLALAASCNADCYVTGDVPHHVALYADQSGLPIIILQHYAAERIYIKRLGEILSGLARNNNTDVQFEVSEYERNPIRMEEV